MKRFFVLCAALLTVCALMTSCKKTPKVDPNMPSAAWEENDGFATVEIVDGFKAPISVTAPLGLDVLTLTGNVIPSMLVGTANNLIGLSANKGEKPVFDLIDDAGLGEKLKELGFPTGTALRGRSTAVSFNLARLVTAIIGDNEALVKNNDTFEFEIRVRDMEGNEMKKIARFHNTSAPELTANPAEVSLNDSNPISCSVNIKAEGKLKGLVMTFETESTGIRSFIAKRSTSAGMTLTVDLVNDDKAKNSFADLGIATGSQVTGKELTLSLGKLIDQLKVEVEQTVSSTHKITVEATDENGKKGVAAVTLRFTSK